MHILVHYGRYVLWIQVEPIAFQCDTICLVYFYNIHIFVERGRLYG